MRRASEKVITIPKPTIVVLRADKISSFQWRPKNLILALNILFVCNYLRRVVEVEEPLPVLLSVALRVVELLDAERVAEPDAERLVSVEAAEREVELLVALRVVDVVLLLVLRTVPLVLTRVVVLVVRVAEALVEVRVVAGVVVGVEEVVVDDF